MTSVLMIRDRMDSLSGLIPSFEQNGNIDVVWVESGAQALNKAMDITFDLVVAPDEMNDMTGLEFARKLITVNAMANIAVTSSLSHESFHEESEGLGILMQLPPRPGNKDGTALLDRLGMIMDLTHKQR